MTDSFEHEDISREVIKCVVVGDSAVGKTRLICARACDQKVGLEQLLTVHAPTVWAIDSYRTSRQILEKSFQSLDNIPVSLRLWDTFGDHNNDRRFAYGRSDVVLLCFSVLNPRSLQHAKTVWYPEIRRMCPGAPVVLVGCKNDLRHLCLQPWFQKLVAERRPFGKPMLPSDVVFPEQGRMVAKEIGAPYYETSVLTFFGVHDLFANVIRAALCRRRQVRFWMTTLDSVRPPLLQAPYLPPRPTIPDVHIVQSTYKEDLIRSASFLLQNGQRKGLHLQRRARDEVGCFYDCMVEIRSVGESSITIPSHKLILASSCEFLRHILVCSEEHCIHCCGVSDKIPTKETESEESRHIFDDDRCQLLPQKSPEDLAPESNDAKTSEKQLFERSPACFLENIGRENCSCVELAKTVNCFGGPRVEYSQEEVTVIRVFSKEKKPCWDTYRSLFHFLYTGEIPAAQSDATKKILGIIARGWNLPLLEKLVSTPGTEEDYMIRQQFLEERKENLVRLAIDASVFCDAKFLLDTGDSVCANRFLLASRSEVMEAMFSNQFREGLSSQVAMPGVSLEAMKRLLLYLYTDDIARHHQKSDFLSSDTLETLEIGNRLCLPRLVNLIESAVISECANLVTLKHFGDEGVILEDILSVLEDIQMCNATQLSRWCLNFLCCNYNRACKQHPKLVKNLSQANQDVLARNRYPPVWYLKEFDWYERSLRDRQMYEENNAASACGRLKRARTRSGCLCFTKASRNQTESGSV